VPVEGSAPLILATRDTWPGAKDLYCHPVDVWPDAPEVVETHDVERCWRAGAAVHLILRRRRGRRSLFVWTQARGRSVIFWRSQVSMRSARPGLRVPQARGLERAMRLAVDSRERYPWRFARYAVESERRTLPVGDYAVLDGERILAAVERKSLDNLATSLAGGELALVLAELEQLPHAAVVVEGRLSDLVKAGERGRVRPGWLLNLVAALQVAHPSVPWVFAETSSLAQDYAYRWLAACARAEGGGEGAAADAAGAATLARPRRDRGPSVLDAVARRAIAVREATEGGIVWTSADLARRCGVGPVTAWKDLRALVAEGLLEAEGDRRRRRYRARRGPGGET
jgi:hypothetical protein